MRWSAIRDTVADIYVGVMFLAVIAGLGWALIWGIQHQGEEVRARQAASRELAADLFEAFKAVPIPAPEGAFRDAIERTSEAPLVASERAELLRYSRRADRIELSVRVEVQYVPRDSAYVAWSGYCFDYTLPRTRAGAAGYREVECPVEKPLICKALGEDCKIFGLSGRVP